MIGRYIRTLAASGPTVADTKYTSDVLGSSTSTTVNYTVGLSGPPGAVVKLSVALYDTNNSLSEFSVDSNIMTYGSQLNVTLDGSGIQNVAVRIKGGAASGDYLSVHLKILSTTIGAVGSPNQRSYFKAV